MSHLQERCNEKYYKSYFKTFLGQKEFYTFTEKKKMAKPH